MPTRITPDKPMLIELTDYRNVYGWRELMHGLTETMQAVLRDDELPYPHLSSVLELMHELIDFETDE